MIYQKQFTFVFIGEDASIFKKKKIESLPGLCTPFCEFTWMRTEKWDVEAPGNI